MKSIDPALVVILGGVSAALHVGKLPPALPVLAPGLGLGLVESGFALSLVQFAGMAFGLVAGLAADAWGARRCMLAGLGTISVASLLGGLSDTATALLLSRALEGAGFLMASLPAPALLRRIVPRERLNVMLGMWGAYMPFGTAAALLLGPAVMAGIGWRGWWWSLAIASMVIAIWVRGAVPSDPPRRLPSGARTLDNLSLTLRSAGPWLAALCFAAYSFQWLAVIGFLPTIYSQAGLAVAWAAMATAAAAAANILGNVASGRLLQAGVPAPVLLRVAFGAMALGTAVAFSPFVQGLPAPWEVGVRFAAVLVFSAIGGMVPGTLFSVSVRLAPSEQTISATVGWMQQWSAIGQFCGPPVVAWLAYRQGGWGMTWVATCAAAASGVLLAGGIGRLLARSTASDPPRLP